MSTRKKNSSSGARDHLTLDVENDNQRDAFEEVSDERESDLEFDDLDTGQISLGEKQEYIQNIRTSTDSEALEAPNQNDLEFDDLDDHNMDLDEDKEYTNTAINVFKLQQEEASKNKASLSEEEMNEHFDKRQVNDQEINDEDLSEEIQSLLRLPMFKNSGNNYPQVHGRYYILDHLVDGGMAKICRSRFLSEGKASVDKVVILKTIKEQFSNDDYYKQMFIDEINVSFGLEHPNVTAMYDYGKMGQKFFVSMEYIHGKDLNIVLDKIKNAGQLLPIPFCLYVISKTCEGLFYAHSYVNKLTDSAYNIVHRDISPHNIMIDFDGNIKVIDFGIAKSESNLLEEQEGMVKGKIHYLAPEYIEGKPIDHRYDQFAVGLTLWELLTGKRAFKGKEQIDVLKNVLKCHIEIPSNYNRKISYELERVIMKSLSRNPNERYKDMNEFNKAILKIFRTKYPDYDQETASNYMKKIFNKDYQNDLEELRNFGEVPIEEINTMVQRYHELKKLESESLQKSDIIKNRFSHILEQNQSVSEGIEFKSSLELDLVSRKKALKARELYRKKIQKSINKKVVKSYTFKDKIKDSIYVAKDKKDRAIRYIENRSEKVKKRVSPSLKGGYLIASFKRLLPYLFKENNTKKTRLHKEKKIKNTSPLTSFIIKTLEALLPRTVLSTISKFMNFISKNSFEIVIVLIIATLISYKFFLRPRIHDFTSPETKVSRQKKDKKLPKIPKKRSLSIPPESKFKKEMNMKLKKLEKEQELKEQSAIMRFIQSRRVYKWARSIFE